MKYKLTENKKEIASGVVLNQIQALKDFGEVKTGDVGGWIESESNLSQEGDCWVSENALVSGNALVYGDAVVYENAKVFGNAQVSENAQVSGTAQVSGNAQVSGDAQVSENAQVSGTAQISGDARVFENAWVSGDAVVFENAKVSGNALVYGDALVSENAWVSGNARVFENALVYGTAQVSGDALVSGDAKVGQSMCVKFGRTATDLTVDLIANIESQTSLKTINNEVYCYKHVREDLTSLYDSKFQYTVNEWIEVDEPDLSNKSCASGLHVSNAQYWNNQGGAKILFCKVRLEDIITVQEGKIRCKKIFVIGVCEGLVF